MVSTPTLVVGTPHQENPGCATSDGQHRVFSEALFENHLRLSLFGLLVILPLTIFSDLMFTIFFNPNPNPAFSQI